MERIQIYRKGPVDGYYPLAIKSMVERDEELVIELEGKECYSINEGDQLTFMRTVNGENGYYRVFQANVTVKEEDSQHRIHTTLLPTYKTFLDNINWYKLFYNEETSHYVITCKEEHFLFAQDLNPEIPQELYFKDTSGKLLCTFSGISAMNRYSNMPITVEDCLIYKETEETCGKDFKNFTTYYYTFFPVSESRYSFILTDFSKYLGKKARYFETKFNPFYYYTVELNDKGIPVETDSNGNGVRHCVFYEDVWFANLKNTLEKKYINSGSSNSWLYENRSYYNVSIDSSVDINETSLGSEDFFSEQFAKNLEDSMIPDYIDMERIKYTPHKKIVRAGKTFFEPVTKITIYPHFRDRVVVDPSNNTNTLSTSGNLYYDGWYIDTDNNGSKYWNGYDWSEINDSSSFMSLFNEFIVVSGKTSDLIGFLNFNDNDIYYRKNKVNKSFFRFSFYNSKDPIEQRLLCYSTVFLDGTELLSKFLKQSMFVEDNEKIKDKMDENYVVINEITSGNPNVKVVFCENTNVDSRLDCTITLTNEFDKSRSAEGFNIYLFKDDVPEVNSSKTIYMKVEFNHAGNGKTIPMVMWPKDTAGAYTIINIDNFVDSLYIPIEIREYEGKYVYSIKNASYDDDGNIELVLLEPKLEY